MAPAGNVYGLTVVVAKDHTPPKAAQAETVGLPSSPRIWVPDTVVAEAQLPRR